MGDKYQDNITWRLFYDKKLGDIYYLAVWANGRPKIPGGSIRHDGLMVSALDSGQASGFEPWLGRCMVFFVQDTFLLWCLSSPLITQLTES